MRFINDDVKLKNGGRKAFKITKQELQDKIINNTEAKPSVFEKVLTYFFCYDLLSPTS